MNRPIKVELDQLREPKPEPRSRSVSREREDRDEGSRVPENTGRRAMKDWIKFLSFGLKTYNIENVTVALKEIPSSELKRLLSSPPYPLHNVISFCRKPTSSPLNIQTCEMLVPMVLKKLSLNFLTVVCEQGNTLLNEAINLKSVYLVRYLLKLGSPLDIKNHVGISAVESAILAKHDEIFRMVLMKGGTFHFLLENVPKFWPYIKDRDFFDEKLNRQVAQRFRKVANECYKIFSTQCDYWTGMLAPEIVVMTSSPIITLPRAKLNSHGHNQTVFFRMAFPMTYDEQPSEYLLAIFPFANEIKNGGKKLHVRKEAVKFTQPPKLNSSCLYFVLNIASTRSMNYLCTNEVRAQLENPEVWKIWDNEPNFRFEQEAKNDFKSIFKLDIAVDVMEQFDFLAVQLIGFKYGNTNYSTKRPLIPGNRTD